MTTAVSRLQPTKPPRNLLWLGLLALPALALFGKELPALVRYLKIERM